MIIGLLENILKINDHHVLKCSSGKDSIDLLINHFPEIDLIITNYHINKINGPELAESVKKLYEYKETDIVLYTNADYLAVMQIKDLIY
ncbi:MAG: hypothetical protein K2P53_04875 [Rickettsiales bacterium]|nr:hypothetical protein [Rickettsiales bacterium]